MLQETTTAPTGAGNNAAALQQMGFADMIQNLDALGWVVLITLVIMSAMSIYWIVINTFKNISLRRSADRVVSTFWETPNAQDAIRYMEEQPRSEPSLRWWCAAAWAASSAILENGSLLGCSSM